MQHNQVGRSGLVVSELSLGTMLFGEGQSRSTPKKDAIDICHVLVDAGGSHIDTANANAGGESERIIGGGFLTGKYVKGDKPTEGRIATSEDTVEEAWWRRNTDRYWAIMDILQSIASAHHATASQIALAWLRRHPQIATVIIGPRTLEQCHDNLASVNITLSAEEWQALDDVSALADSYPYSMIRAYGME